MGIKSKLKEMSREYQENPKAQYFKYLNKVLNLSGNSKVSKQEVMAFVKSWMDKKHD